jgi:hypothetical protein
MLALRDGRRRLCNVEAFIHECATAGLIGEEHYASLRADLDAAIAAINAGTHQARQNWAVPIAERIEWQASEVGQPDLFGNNQLTSAN